MANNSRFWVDIEQDYYIEVIYRFLKKVRTCTISSVSWVLIVLEDTTVVNNYRTERMYIHDWPKSSVTAGDSTIRLRVYACDDDGDILPKYPSCEGEVYALERQKIPTLTKTGVEKIADLHVDLSVVPRRLLKTFTRKGIVHSWCDPWLRITYSFATVGYSLVYKGTDYGNVQSGFDD